MWCGTLGHSRSSRDIEREDDTDPDHPDQCTQWGKLLVVLEEDVDVVEQRAGDQVSQGQLVQCGDGHAGRVGRYDTTRVEG